MRRWVLCLLALAYAAPGLAEPQHELSWRPAWLAVEINGTAAQDTIAVISRDGRLWLDRTFVERWRFTIAEDRAPREFLGRLYYAFDELAPDGQLSWALDTRRQLLSLTADPRALRSTDVSAAAKATRSNVPQQPGAFLNYDLSSASVAARSLHAGLFELTAFRGPLAFTATQAAVSDDGHEDFSRLDTSLTADFPERRASLRFGDTIASGGQWGRAVRLGGLQWATNFQTQPDLLTLPLASVAGEAAVPSTVDVFVNGSLAATRDVAAGPFSITELPIVSGSGEVTARVRDALGREHLISQRFYASPQLLRAGLDDYSFEIGKVREGYATTSDRYGEAFVQGTWRRGLLDGTTGEVRAQVLEDRFAGGLGLTQSVAGVGVVQAAIAASGGSGASGVLAQAGYEYDGRRFSFGAQARWNSSTFRELGDVGTDAERWDVTAHAGWSSPRLGSFAAALVRREDRIKATIASATYSRHLWQSAFLNVTVSEDFAAHDTFVFAGVTRLLGRGRSADVTVSGGDGATAISGELRQNRRRALGIAYGLQAEQGERERVSADAEWRGSAATIGGEVAHRYGATGVRVQGSGALAVVGGYWAALPRIDETFAILSVPDMPNLPVYLEHQLVAHTDGDGVAKLAGLRPYERNTISVDPVNVPLDAQIGQSRLEVVPYGRGGVALQMEIVRTTSALLRIERENGDVLPPGARVAIGERTYPVGIEGVVFVPELSGNVAVIAAGGAETCSAAVDASAVRPLPETTRLVCRSRAGSDR
jgi:outer membrane usher protein